MFWLGPGTKFNYYNTAATFCCPCRLTNMIQSVLLCLWTGTHCMCTAEVCITLTRNQASFTQRKAYLHGLRYSDPLQVSVLTSPWIQRHSVLGHDLPWLEDHLKTTSVLVHQTSIKPDYYQHKQAQTSMQIHFHLVPGLIQLNLSPDWQNVSIGISTRFSVYYTTVKSQLRCKIIIPDSQNLPEP